MSNLTLGGSVTVTAGAEFNLVGTAGPIQIGGGVSVSAAVGAYAEYSFGNENGSSTTINATQMHGNMAIRFTSFKKEVTTTTTGSDSPTIQIQNVHGQTLVVGRNQCYGWTTKCSGPVFTSVGISYLTGINNPTTNTPAQVIFATFTPPVGSPTIKR